jgi:hypothetical protein
MKRIETKVLFRPHVLGQFMTEPQGKNNTQKYAEALEALEKAKAAEELAAIKKAEAKAEAVDLEPGKEDETPIRKGGKSPAQKYRDAVTNGAKIVERHKVAKEKREKAEILVKELELVKDEVLLSRSCIKALKTVAIEIRYKRRKRLDNKFIKKGSVNEPDSTELYSEWKGEHLEQNKTRRQNDYFTGETDLEFLDVLGDIEKVTDIKTSYDIDTFEDNRGEEAKKDHIYQGLGYCDLTGAKFASVAYCLTNTYFTLINDEIRRETYKLKADELEGFDVPFARVIEIVKDHIFDYETFVEFFLKSPVQYVTRDELTELMVGHHPDAEAQEMFNSFVEVELQDRVIEIEIECNPDEIERIKKRLYECRIYLAKVYNIHHVDNGDE